MPRDPNLLRRVLLAHFDAHARELPWRAIDDPYAIWVSEIMLQQTRVDTVVPYFERWMERFPNVEALAAADQDEVLKEWEGLGYYSRARNLHRAAAVVRERFHGRLPDSAEELRELPGVGEYTAGAVASIAFGEAVPAVDGNVRRVLCRVFDLEDPTAAQLRSLAAGLVDPGRPGDFNEALMELGATVCTPSSPDCGGCPVSGLCLALDRDTVADRPAPRRRTRVRDASFAVAVLADGEGRVLLQRRPEDGLLGGMWTFPDAEVADGDEAPASICARSVAESLVPGASLAGECELDPVAHTFSHIRALYVPYLFRVESAPHPPPDSELSWASPVELTELALPIAQQKILQAARAHLQSPVTSP